MRMRIPRHVWRSHSQHRAANDKERTHAQREGGRSVESRGSRSGDRRSQERRSPDRLSRTSSTFIAFGGPQGHGDSLSFAALCWGAVTIFTIGGEREAGHGDICVINARGRRASNFNSCETAPVPLQEGSGPTASLLIPGGPGRVWRAGRERQSGAWRRGQFPCGTTPNRFVRSAPRGYCVRVSAREPYVILDGSRRA
jgi:hypothetical protein